MQTSLNLHQKFSIDLKQENQMERENKLVLFVVAMAVIYGPLVLLLF